jgi:IgA Peptidase M64
MSTADGRVVGATKIIDRGPDSARWDLVLVAEGYTQAQLAQFATDAQNLAQQILATPPFDTFAPAINVHRIDVASTESGADHMDYETAGCESAEEAPKTYFDATFCSQGIDRYLTVNTGTVLQVVDDLVPHWDVAMVVVNSTAYGGSGLDDVPVLSLHADALETALHELGHAAFGLADEYESLRGCTGADLEDDLEDGRAQYDGPEPVEPNVTANADRETIKWRALLTPGVRLPTTENADCSECDPQRNPFPAVTVGAYEGAGKYHCGLYRPTFNCMMRSSDQPFCAVCEERIRVVLTPFLPRRKRMDFTLITPTAQQFGNVDAPPPLGGGFVGAAKEFTFNCPGVDAGQHAILMYQVSHARALNAMTINGVSVPNAVSPTTTDPQAVNASVVLVSPNTLRASGNVLRIQAALEAAPPPPPGGPNLPQPAPSLDEFMIDNVVLLYKTA